MGKPGNLDVFDSGPYTIQEWVAHQKEMLDAFQANMEHLKLPPRSDYNWFYTYGFWNEALEFRDDFPETFEEFKELERYKLLCALLHQRLKCVQEDQAFLRQMFDNHVNAKMPSYEELSKMADDFKASPEYDEMLEILRSEKYEYKEPEGFSALWWDWLNGDRV